MQMLTTRSQEFCIMLHTSAIGTITRYRVMICLTKRSCRAFKVQNDFISIVLRISYHTFMKCKFISVVPHSRNFEQFEIDEDARILFVIVYRDYLCSVDLDDVTNYTCIYRHSVLLYGFSSLSLDRTNR